MNNGYEHQTMKNDYECQTMNNDSKCQDYQNCSSECLKYNSKCQTENTNLNVWKAALSV